MRVREVRRVVEELFTLRQAIESSPSATGPQLERARTGPRERASGYNMRTSDDSSDYYRSVITEERYSKFAVLLQLWEKLDVLEKWAMALLYLPSGHAEYERVVHKSELVPLFVHQVDGEGECNAVKGDGTRCRNPRKPGEARCHIQSHIDQASPVKTYVTPPPASEELVCVATPPQPEHVDPTPYDRVAVQYGSEPRRRDDEDIARFVDMKRTAGAVDHAAYEDLRLVRGTRATYRNPEQAAQVISSWLNDGLPETEKPYLVTPRMVRRMVMRAREAITSSALYDLLERGDGR